MQSLQRSAAVYLATHLLIALSSAAADTPPTVDMSGVEPDAKVTFDRPPSGRLSVEWPIGNDDSARATFRFSPEYPLIEDFVLLKGKNKSVQVVACDLNPCFAVTVGSRNLDTPAKWTIFFDKVHERPYRRYPANLDLHTVRVSARGERGTVTFGKLTAGPFSGELSFSFFAGSPLVLTEAVLSTAEDGRAVLYDAGLVVVPPRLETAAPGYGVDRYVWTDFDGTTKSRQAIPAVSGDPRAVNHRAVAAEIQKGGAIAVFPPPHQFFYPLDFADNFGFNWFGRDYPSAPAGDGFGIRQPPEGDRRFVPWINAPPGTKQRLGVFYLLSAEGAPGERGKGALKAVERYTRGDRYPQLPGYKTFTSHYHIEHTLEILKRRAAGEKDIPADLVTPGFTRVFRDTGVDIVHLAEFHNGQTPKLGTAERLEQLRLLHRECERLSDDKFLLLPGEEPNVHLGGHWISLFPKPVLWVLNRPEGKPFVEKTAAGETVYHVGGPADVLELMRRERGLMWTAHARIKSSFGYPDGYRDTEFFRSPQFLGAAWKAMPADLSQDTLGRRVLDLLDDMNQWSPPKQAIGEVDIFQVRPGYEFYGHANVNYIRLEKLPKFADGWQPLLDTLRAGRFFTTTGEILVTDFDWLRQGEAAPAVRARLQWTFPLRHAEVVAGDGKQILRHRIDLAAMREFGDETFTWKLPAEFATARWLRLEVWDIATNGAFAQPLHAR